MGLLTVSGTGKGPSLVHEFIGDVFEVAISAIIVGVTLRSGQMAIAHFQRKFAEKQAARRASANSATPAVAATTTTTTAAPVGATATTQPAVAEPEQQNNIPDPSIYYGGARILLALENVGLATDYKNFEAQLFRNEPHSSSDVLERASRRDPRELCKALAEIAKAGIGFTGAEAYARQRQELHAQGLTKHWTEREYPAAKLKHAEEKVLEDAAKIWHGVTMWLATHRPVRNQRPVTNYQRFARRIIR